MSYPTANSTANVPEGTVLPEAIILPEAITVPREEDVEVETLLAGGMVQGTPCDDLERPGPSHQVPGPSHQVPGPSRLPSEAPPPSREGSGRDMGSFWSVPFDPEMPIPGNSSPLYVSTDDDSDVEFIVRDEFAISVGRVVIPTEEDVISTMRSGDRASQEKVFTRLFSAWLWFFYAHDLIDYEDFTCTLEGASYFDPSFNVNIIQPTLEEELSLCEVRLRRAYHTSDQILQRMFDNGLDDCIDKLSELMLYVEELASLQLMLETRDKALRQIVFTTDREKHKSRHRPRIDVSNSSRGTWFAG